MVVARVEFPKRQETPPLVCVEPAEIPHEGVLAATALSRLLSSPSRTYETLVSSRVTCRRQLTNSCRRDRIHVTVANFSQEEIVLPKATVVGVAEEISSSVVTAINNGDGPGNTPHDKRRRNGRRDVYTVDSGVKFKRYLGNTLGHLNTRERSLMEPVFAKYMNVFHDDKDNQFKGTDMVEHRIITGNAKPMRKAPYRVRFPLRGEMKSQVRDILQKGVVEPSLSPWQLRPSKSQRIRQMVARNNDFAWTFALSIQSRNSIPTPCRSSRKLLPHFTAVGFSLS